MNLKTYLGKSMTDALAKVKKDLGRDAVILQTRTLKRGGLLGVGAKSSVEITATIDEKVLTFRNAADQSRAAQSRAAQSRDRQGAGRTASVGQTRPRQEAVDAPIAVNLPAPDPALRREVVEIHEMVRSLLRRADHAEHPNLPPDLIEYYTSLVANDVAAELASDLLNCVASNLQATPDTIYTFTREHVAPLLQEALIEMLPAAAPLALTSADRPTVVAMVGPTGVGKTTTIAKLAANMKLREKKKVGLLTIDSYRIGAVEQLRTYANILKVPLISVMAPAEIKPALQRMSDLDLVLIDTAGRSQKDDLRIAELNRFLEEAAPDQIHLVLSTTSREETSRQAIEKFTQLGARQIIFTKIDEAVGFGVILNVLKTVDMKLSYLTTGQSVPDDIEIGSATRVARLILDSITPSLTTHNQARAAASPSAPCPAEGSPSIGTAFFTGRFAPPAQPADAQHSTTHREATRR
jgi:flagellar biosynthesis protein FlhF